MRRINLLQVDASRFHRRRLLRPCGPRNDRDGGPWPSRNDARQYPPRDYRSLRMTERTLRGRTAIVGIGETTY